MLSPRCLHALDPDHGLRAPADPLAVAISRPSRPRQADYFIAELIELNLLLRRTLPVLFTIVTIASAIPAAIRPYSIAVAPFSSATKDLSKAIVNSCSSAQRKVAPFSEW